MDNAALYVFVLQRTEADSFLVQLRLVTCGDLGCERPTFCF